MASESRLTLKLLVDTSKHKVLFAEAGKDFVDFLFSFLAMSVGSVIKILTDQGLDECIARLFESVENLSGTYIRSGLDKSSLLDLFTPSLPSTQTPLLLLQSGDKTTASKKYYICGKHHTSFSCVDHRSCNVVTDVKGTTCRNCRNSMTHELEYIYPDAAASSVKGAGSSGETGYVKEVVTYMVTDDLVVTPMSTISSITLLNKLNVKEVGTLEEKVVEVGMKEAVALLKASFRSKKALTDVFLGVGDVSIT